MDIIGKMTTLVLKDVIPDTLLILPVKNVKNVMVLVLNVMIHQKTDVNLVQEL